MRGSFGFYAAALAVAVAAVVPVSGVAGAQEPSLADKASARDLFNEAVALRNKGDAKGALAKFQTAYSLWPSPSTGLELGRTHMELGELIEARERFLETAKLSKKTTETPAAQTAREEAQKLADSLEPRIPQLRFQVSGAPAGATVRVSVDGRELPPGAVTAPRKVNPGKHTVLAKTDGANDVSVTVDVKEGESRDVTLAFSPAVSSTATAPSDTATTTATSSPTTPETATATRGTSPLVYVGFGVAAVGIVVGGITGAIAGSTASKLDDGCTDGRCPPASHADVDSYNRMSTISTISFIAAGVGVGVGVYGLLSSGSSEPTKAASVKPWIGLGSAGVGGTF